MADSRKPLEWVGSSLNDLKEFPSEVQGDIGYSLDRAQLGAKPASAKPLKGFGGASVLEIVDDFDGGTYRAVYTVKFALAVYVLHAFQKKSKTRIETPKQEIELVKRRLRAATQHYAEKYGGELP